MMEHKFKSIRASLTMYCNKRTYKTRTDIDFIESIISDYQRLCIHTDEEPDLVSAISLKLHKEYIGRFTYIAIKNIALKAKNLMWGIFAAEILIAYIDRMVTQSQTIIIVAVSLLLTIIMYFYSVIKGIEEKQEILIDEVIHYVRNIYPVEKIKQRKETECEQRKVDKEGASEKVIIYPRVDQRQEDMRKREENTKIEKDDVIVRKTKTVQNKERNETVNKGNMPLSAKDIAKLLKNLS